MKKTILLILVIFGLAVFGCSQKKIATDYEEPAKTEASAEKESAATAEIEVSRDDVSSQDIAKADTSVQVETVPPPSLDDVYFDFDRYDITQEGRQTLLEISDWLISSKASVLVEGHCDERGTNEYNLALGDRRASSVKDFLIASGVAPGKIETISFGEEKPVCSSPTESCWSKNRRAHMVVEGGR